VASTQNPVLISKFSCHNHAAAYKALKSGKYFNPDGMGRNFSGLKKLLLILNIVNKSDKSIISLALTAESLEEDSAVTEHNNTGISQADSCHKNSL